LEIISKIFSYVLIDLVKLYQYTMSPLMGDVCRFKPSCSNYMIEAITKHGVIKGVWLGTKRIFRCHPWGGKGYDPVPDKKDIGNK